MKNSRILLMGLLSLSLFTFSCEDDDENVSSIDQAVTSSEDDALADAEYASVFEFVDDEASADETFSAGRTAEESENMPECAEVVKDTVNRTLTIDFGDTGCECNDGVVRSGKIIATFQGEYREPGSSVSVTLENYTADEHTFSGTKTVTNMREEDGHFKYTITVEDASIEGPDGVFSWESSHTVERIEGNDTRRPYDDVYQVTGQSSGVNRRGIAFEKTIESPLIKDRKVRCLSNFVSGIVTLTNDDGGVVSIDYGDGTCDRKATLTINDNVNRTIFVR